MPKKDIKRLNSISDMVTTRCNRYYFSTRHGVKQILKVCLENSIPYCSYAFNSWSIETEESASRGRRRPVKSHTYSMSDISDEYANYGRISMFSADKKSWIFLAKFGPGLSSWKIVIGLLLRKLRLRISDFTRLPVALQISFDYPQFLAATIFHSYLNAFQTITPVIRLLWRSTCTP